MSLRRTRATEKKKKKKRKERNGRIIYALNDYEQKCLRDWREKELKTVTI
jgi:hypothetical protein